MISAVLDTNVLVSALLTPRGACARVLDAAAEDRFRPLLSPEILAEYREVLGRAKFGLSPTTAAAVVDGFRRLAVELVPGEPLRACRDPEDDKFLACACAGGAGFVVTGNARHFPGVFRGVRVVSPAAFLRAL